VCFFQFAREAAGATGTRLSLRPLFWATWFQDKLGRIAPREGSRSSARSHGLCLIAAHPSRRGLPAAPQDEGSGLVRSQILMVRRRIAPSRTWGLARYRNWTRL